MLVVALLGVGIGALLGLLGAGGSILAVPALVYAAGQPLAVAIPTSLVVVGASAAVAAVPRMRSGLVRWPVAAVFAATGIPAAFGGAAVNHLLDPRVVLIGFAGVMVAAAIRMLRHQPAAEEAATTAAVAPTWRHDLPQSLAAGALVGFLTGLFGVGGGFLIVPALVILLGLPMASAVGTSLVVVAINSAAGFVANAADSPLDYPLIIVFTLSAIVAATVATHMAVRVESDRLRRWFAYLVLAVAALVLVLSWARPHAAG